MLRSSLWDYSDAYILVKVKVTITGPKYTATMKKADERNKGVTFKDYDHLLIAKGK